MNDVGLREPLHAYHEKRDFSRTPEPRGEASTPKRRASKGRASKRRAPAKQLLYVIQKHAARQLHYDFRLELNGVLKSWAVPKGPSMVPGEKRLARHVEDHPIEYGDFEGTIPKGEYGGGTVLLWDRGSWEPVGDPEEAYRRGRLKLRLHGEKLTGGFALVRMRGGEDGDQNWLLIKERDASAADSGTDILSERPNSVASGRTIEEIAVDPDSATWTSNRTQEKPARKKAAKGARAAARVAPIDVAAIPGAHEARMPDTVAPQLATLVSEPPSGPKWVYEMKLDGFRILAFIEDGEARLITRGQQDWTERFFTVAGAAAALPVKQAVLDGEIVVLRADGVSDFQALQNAILEDNAAKLVYFVFDLLHLDGYDLRGATLSARKEALKRLLAGEKAGGRIRYSDHLEAGGADVLANACALGAEGILAKDRDAPYVGKRGSSWLKIKCTQRQELVVGGFTDPSGSRAGLGALLLGYHDEKGRLVYAGKVGTGLSAKLLRDLSARLKGLERDTSPFADGPRMRAAHWVKPAVVVEVRFHGWTRDDRVRQGAFIGLREDRDPKSVVRETPRPPP